MRIQGTQTDIGREYLKSLNDPNVYQLLRSGGRAYGKDGRPEACWFTRISLQPECSVIWLSFPGYHEMKPYCVAHHAWITSDEAIGPYCPRGLQVPRNTIILYTNAHRYDSIVNMPGDWSYRVIELSRSSSPIPHHHPGQNVVRILTRYDAIEDVQNKPPNWGVYQLEKP